MAVSVVVSNFNGVGFLPRLLETLRNQAGVRVEIIVVDRHSTDGSRDWLERQRDVKLLFHPAETGLVSGYTLGYRSATYEHIFFCNEDMWLDSQCLRCLEGAIDLGKGQAVADPWQWSYDGAVRIHAVTRFERVPWNWNCPYPFRRYSFRCDGAAKTEIPFPCAGAFLIHRTPFEQVGRLDTRFFLDSEDVDLGLRLWKLGWKSVSVPDAKVYHAVGASNDQVLEQGKSTVCGRRYVSGRANIMMMQLKHLKTPFLPAVGLWWSLEVLKMLAKGDIGRSKGAVAAGRFVFSHLPALLAERRDLAAHLPGIRSFFVEPRFNE